MKFDGSLNDFITSALSKVAQKYEYAVYLQSQVRQYLD
jgi:hypothetical protein